MSLAPGNDNNSVASFVEAAEWDVEICDASITVNHKPSKLRFWFRRTSDQNGLCDDIDISGDEEHPDFDEILDEAAQIAQDHATEE